MPDARRCAEEGQPRRRRVIAVRGVPVSDGGRLAATGDFRLGEDVAEVDLAVFSARKSAG
jgi:hypothetical protein